MVEIKAENLQTALNDLQYLLVRIYEAELVGISTDESTVVLGWSLHVTYRHNCLSFNL